jgi:SAM-dependent methyltransferase
MKTNRTSRYVRLLTTAATVVLALTLLTVSAPAQDEHGHDRHGHDPGQHDKNRHDATVHNTFPDAEQWAARFEDPARDEWQLGAEVVRALVSREDLIIADIGSATGYFPVRFARAVPAGAVIGSDIEPTMVMYLNDRARKEKLTNLTSVLAAPDDPHLPQRVDLVFICNTYHHINDRVGYLKGLQSQLREGARVAIVDFRLDSPRGPDHKLDPARVREEFAKAGYRSDVEHTFLPDQYFHVYKLEETGK